MTSRERVVRALRRQNTDRPPFDFSNGFAPAMLDEMERRTGSRDPAEWFATDVRTLGIGPTRLQTDYTPYHHGLPPRAWIDEWGVGHVPTESTDPGHSHLDGFLHPMERLATLREVQQYPLPDIEADYRLESLARRAEELHQRGLAVAVSMECTLFETAWYLRGMEQLFVDFVERPALAEALLDRILDKRLIQARKFAEAGVDVIRTGDDVATQRGPLMSLPMWRRWIKPRLTRIIAEAKRTRPDLILFYHSDGDVAALIPDLLEIGVDVLNPVQPECMDPADLKRRHGSRLSFWGTVGIQTTLPFGTPDEVRQVVRQRIETVGQGGGLLLSPAHMIEPDVPWENLEAFVDAVKSAGR